MSATELEPAEVKVRQEIAYGIDQRVRGAIRAGRGAWWDLAEALYEFDEAHGWTAIGYDSIGEWLADPEITMKGRTYYRWVKVWRDAVIKQGLDVDRLRELDPSKIDIVMPSVNNGQILMEEAMSDAKVLGAADLREKYAKKTEPKAKVEPKPEPEPVIAQEFDDVIDGSAVERRVEGANVGTETARPAPAPMVILPEHPTSTEWAHVVKTAKSRKMTIGKYVLKMTTWERCGKDDGNHVEDWIVPQRAEIRAFINELEGCLHSGQVEPRVSAQLIRVGLEALATLELLP